MLKATCSVLKAVFSFLFLLINGSVLNFAMHGPVLILMFVWPWAYRRLTEMILSCGVTLLVFFTNKLLGVRVRSFGDRVQRHEKTVVVMNHRTRLDWLYFFNYLFRARVLNRQKITLKAPLKWVPMIGWSLQTAGYMFLNRNAAEDEENIRNSLIYSEELGCKPNILIFPEGTDLSPENKQRSWKYAEKMGLQKYDHVLHPRTKGFVWYVQNLRKVGGIQAVHDVTVGYPDEVITSEKDMLMGNSPKQVMFHVKRYSIDELPSDDEGLSKWINQKWREKEVMLHRFYEEEGKFPGAEHGENEFRSRMLWLFSMMWFLADMTFLWLLFSVWWIKVYCVTISTIFMYVTASHGSMSQFEMKVYSSLHKPMSKWAAEKNK